MTALPATISRRGSLEYTCPDCGGRHSHGAGDAGLGDTTGRVSHCAEGGGENVELIIVADERKDAT